MAGFLTWEDLERHGLTECDPRDREELDDRLFGDFLYDHEPGQSVDWLRQTLKSGKPTCGAGFAVELRCSIGAVRNGLRFPWGAGLPEPAEIHRLRDCVREAIAQITAWVDLHGIDCLDTPEEEAAARQGWPDAEGKAWTPPWDILGIEPPDWWGRP
ncbi:hypothetical protein [Ruegeria sp.]|uniref:hypothetical protein n=1 Tax=Ruegeria sp. TaxID=1879320 RepID=UPI003AFFDBCC